MGDSWRPNTAVIKMEISGVLAHRDVALRVVSAACKLVTPHPHGTLWNDFQMKVVSAVGEAFNNIVEHGYDGREPGPIELELGISDGRIAIDLRDWGTSFDPKDVPTPDLASLPESGLGLFIIQSFMDLDYRPGNPNILRLTKSLEAPMATKPRATPPGDDE
jgi:serine/threonine-protein kinase RsbW